MAMGDLARRMAVMSAMRTVVVAMKCPKCMEKRILDDVPVVNICSKCGQAMLALNAAETKWKCLFCGGSHG
jgi:ribosomal protein S27E